MDLVDSFCQIHVFLQSGHRGHAQSLRGLRRLYDDQGVVPSGLPASPDRGHPSTETGIENPPVVLSPPGSQTTEPAVDGPAPPVN